jgi:MoaA/NifB/PqqE/SkfB family radical SAM enzyme
MFYDVIKEIQIEHTSICNLACPSCIRELTPNDKSWFQESYLRDHFYVMNIPLEVLQGLERVNFNGVIGDPCAAPNIINAIQQFVYNSKCFISVSTNGAMRSEAFWVDLAHALGDRGKVIFGIDGLEDTNHIYRVNANYKNVMRNARAFIEAGGNAEWQFISFKHNQHQVETARELSQSMGFKHFFVKPSYRFVIDEMMGVKRYGSDGTLIEPPEHIVYMHPLVKTNHKFTMDEWHASTNESRINCYVQHEASVYIDYQGNLFPCCPLSAGMMARRVIKFNDGWNELWEQHGESINLANNSWDNIINGEFFNEVVRRWQTNYSTGRLAACAGTCSDSELKFNHKAIDGSN